MQLSQIAPQTCLRACFNWPQRTAPSRENLPKCLGGRDKTCEEVSLSFSDSAAGAKSFSATRWSIVVAARGQENDAQAALSWLCERYWFPLFAYVRGRGNSPHDAEDLVQGFFEWLLRQNIVERAKSDRGQFRAFLLTCLNHYISREWQKGQRLKRGGGAILLPIDNGEALWQREMADHHTPEQSYERTWAHMLLDRVLARLRNECDADGRTGRFDVLQNFVQGERGEVPLAAAAKRFGLSLPAMKSVVHRFRGRFREMIREEIRETVATDEEVDPELQHLFAALGR